MKESESVSRSVVSILRHPMVCSPPGSSAHGFSRQEYWNGLPFLPPGDLPDPGVEPTSLMSPALAGEFLTLPLGSLQTCLETYVHFEFTCLERIRHGIQGTEEITR